MTRVFLSPHPDSDGIGCGCDSCCGLRDLLASIPSAALFDDDQPRPCHIGPKQNRYAGTEYESNFQ